MKIGRIILLMGIALSAAVSASAQIKIVSGDRLEAVSNPRLSADSASLHFDVRHIVAEPMNEDDSPQTYIYGFRNTGSKTLQIRRLMSTCSCAAATCSAREVSPGQSAEIRVTYDPEGHPGRFERKVFVYTQDGNDPAAVLRLTVQVSGGADISREWPVQMGHVALKRSEVTFSMSERSVETLRFLNSGDKAIALECETLFLPECLTFTVEPPLVEPGQEGNIKLRYDPALPGARETVKVILKGLGLPPSKSTIKVNFK